jgi:hypothetical protein
MRDCVISYLQRRLDMQCSPLLSHIYSVSGMFRVKFLIYLENLYYVSILS